MTTKSTLADLPENVPNIAGEGLLFAFSGLDGPTDDALVGSLQPHNSGLLFHAPQQRELHFNLPAEIRCLAATNDVLMFDGDGGDVATIAFASAHTLVGQIPGGGRPTLAERGQPAIAGSPAVSTSEMDSMVLCVEGDRFALALAATVEEAGERARAGLRVDLAAVVRDRLAPYRSLPTLADPGRDRLLKKCLSVMRVNAMAPQGVFAQHWSTPDRVPHRDLWLWDSVFHSLAMNHVDPAVSWAYLKSVLDTQRDDGMIPHQTSSTGRSSAITQPPLLAWGIWENFQHTRDRRSLAWAMPRLERYLDWDLAHRDTNKNGLLEWLIEDSPVCRSGESGLDNSQRFDDALLMDAVDFSSFIAQDMHCLAAIAAELGDPSRADLWRKRAGRTAGAILDQLWDPRTGFFFDAHFDGRLSTVKAVTGFLPLLLEELDAERVAAMLKMLADPRHFATPAPVPSIAISQPDWSTDMWRGSTWINTNYLIVRGLRKHGCHAEADALAESTIGMIDRHYRAHGVIFEFYDARDVLSPTQLDRKGPHVEPYDIRRKYDSIRDYHWSAALTFCLLLESGR